MILSPSLLSADFSRLADELAALEAAGIPADLAASVRLPIGEDILAVTPAEIAVSIAAQLIRCRAELRR